MLESLLLKNFQIHRKCLIKFDRHITCIVGPNDQGKTAILRALRWLALNKPSGEEFRRWGSKRTSVRLIINGHTIRRGRSSENIYSLDGQLYKAFGTTIPDPIADFLNIRNENFQMQDDPVFWMSESPPQVARNLNEIVNLNIIDDALSHITHEQRRAKLLVEVSHNRLSDARAKKRELNWVPDFVSGIQRLSQKQKGIEELHKRKEELDNLIDEARHYQSIVSKAEKPLESGRQLLVKGQAIQDQKDRLQKLNSLIKEIESWDEEIVRLSARKKKLQEALARVKRCPVCASPLPSSAVIST